LTLKVYQERLCIYHHGKLIARHARCYERHKDFEDPDHPNPDYVQKRANLVQPIDKMGVTPITLQQKPNEVAHVSV